MASHKNVSVPTFDDLLKHRDGDAVVVTDDQSAIDAASGEVEAANTKLAEANAKLGDDTAALAADEVSIGAAVESGGPYFAGPKSDGTVDAYLPDGKGTYRVVTLKPSSGPL